MFEDISSVQTMCVCVHICHFWLLTLGNNLNMGF